PHAAARIIGIDLDQARALPGVLGVFSGEDFGAGGPAGLHLAGGDPAAWAPRSMCAPIPIASRAGGPQIVPFRRCRANGRVVHAGEPVALAVATTLAAALDAAEAVEVAYDLAPAVTDAGEAVRPGARQIWDEAPANTALDWVGPGAEADEALDHAIAEAA